LEIMPGLRVWSTVEHAVLGTLVPVTAADLALGPSWLAPDQLLGAFGLAGILTIVFVETGLLVGFFLPGDSLLFTGGLLAARENPFAPLWLLLITVPLAAIAGDQVGYLIGKKAGPAVFNRPNSRFFRQEYVTRSHRFFAKYGAKTIVLARFVPIVRTFAPVTAGVARMHYPTFLAYNIVGGLLWGVGVTTLGYFLGQLAFVRNNIEAILILIVVVSVLPVVFELLKARRSGRRGPSDADRDPTVA